MMRVPANILCWVKNSKYSCAQCFTKNPLQLGSGVLSQQKLCEFLEGVTQIVNGHILFTGTGMLPASPE